MNNNRKQKVNSLLDSLTRKELEVYLENKDYIDPKIKEMLNKIKYHREENHFNTISKKISNDFTKMSSSFYKMGQAWIIAFVFECFYDQKYKIKDLKEYLKTIIDHDKELKEYVYDLMKDI